jgi:hypothetical protein
MRTLSSFELHDINGGIEEGTICGVFIGATFGAAVFNPLAGALVFMFTPLACVLDYGLHE